jgi:restriction system protein
MTIPSYRQIMLPLLSYTSDKKEHSMFETIDYMSLEFNLSEDERKQLLPCGRKTVIYNRVAWAKTYLDKAGLLETTRRGYFNITEQGLKVLQENPKAINKTYLQRFPGFNKFSKYNLPESKPKPPRRIA